MESENVFDLAGRICEVSGLKQKDAKTLPGLTLAYIGDCIFELVVRTTLVERGLTHVSELNKKSSSIVRAAAQAELLHSIEEKLTDEEMAVYKRGRNVKSSSTAKNATVVDYRVATGFEALMGYLYLSKRTDRILELCSSVIDNIVKENK